MLTDEKFYNRATKFALLKDVDGKYFTLDEYKNDRITVQYLIQKKKVAITGTFFF